MVKSGGLRGARKRWVFLAREVVTMADDGTSDYGAMSQRNRAPLGTLLAVPVASDAETAVPANAVSAQTAQSVPPQTDVDNPTQGRAGTVFTVPHNQFLYWAAEIPDRVEGITEGDSYLFITSDESRISDNKNKMYRA